MSIFHRPLRASTVRSADRPDASVEPSAAEAFLRISAALKRYLESVEEEPEPEVSKLLERLASASSLSRPELDRASETLAEGLALMSAKAASRRRSQDEGAAAAAEALTDVKGLLPIARNVFRAVPAKTEEATTELLARFEEVQAQSSLAAEAARNIMERLEGGEKSGDSVGVIASSARQAIGRERSAIGHIVANNQSNTSRLKEMGDELESGIVIVNEINEINERSRIIAFNMAVEAARLGEGGRGIRVIVNELRTLNDRTTKFSHEIVGLLKKFRDYNKSLVDEITRGSERLNSEVSTGMEATESAVESLISSAAVTEELSGQIASASVDVQRNLDRVLEALQFQDISRQIVEGGLSILQRVCDLASEAEGRCGVVSDCEAARGRLESLKQEFLNHAKTKDEKIAITEVLN